VFETMLVIAGEPVELDAHLRRLRASVDLLYGAPLPADAGELVLSDARQLDIGRLRLTSTPREDAIGIEVTAVAIDAAIVFPPWDVGPELRSHTIAGWRGGHKWADRRLLESLEAAASPAAALLVDEDGAVLETTRANIFVVRGDGKLVTPPTDGRILPGVTRMRAIEAAREAGIETIEAELTRTDLAEASEIFVTGSVRGVEPVRSLDGVAVSHPRQSVAETIASGLRERWMLPSPGE
jgi:para-aminobenzoate synthetase/4-amino-4-deoxychorismate lyase